MSLPENVCGQSKHINDLYALTLGELEAASARDLLAGLSQRYNLGLTPEEIETLLVRAGWPIPYFLQLLVAQLREGATAPDRVGAAFAGLLGSAARKSFAPWWERLGEELGPVDSAAAERVLTACAGDTAGAPEDQLDAVVAGHWEEQERDRRRAWLLQSLEHDGYLRHVEGRWAFRSPLLREVWVNRGRR